MTSKESKNALNHKYLREYCFDENTTTNCINTSAQLIW